METKVRIIKSAEELFLRYGIKSITMDDIAKHLGMSKKTIYRFFNDKDEVVHSLIQDKIKKDERLLGCMADESKNVVDEVFHIMKHMSAVFGSINPNVFYDLQKYHPKSWKLFMDFKEKFISTMVERSLENGKKQKLIRVDLNSKILARLRIQEIEMGFNPTVFPPDKFKLVDVQLALTEHFLYGVCTLKGHKLINKYKEIIEEE